MRVGDRTDYNKLIISIETDGTITPKEVLAESINIMIQQLEAMQFTGMLENKSTVKATPFAAVSEAAQELETVDAGIDVSDEGEDANTKIKVDDLPLSSRTINTLLLAGIKTVAGLLRKTEDDIIALDGVGAKAVEEIKEALSNLKLELKTKK